MNVNVLLMIRGLLQNFAFCNSPFFFASCKKELRMHVEMHPEFSLLLVCHYTIFTPFE